MQAVLSKLQKVDYVAVSRPDFYSNHVPYVMELDGMYKVPAQLSITRIRRHDVDFYMVVERTPTSPCAETLVGKGVYHTMSHEQLTQYLRMLCHDGCDLIEYKLHTNRQAAADFAASISTHRQRARSS